MKGGDEFRPALTRFRKRGLQRRAIRHANHGCLDLVFENHQRIESAKDRHQFGGPEIAAAVDGAVNGHDLVIGQRCYGLADHAEGCGPAFLVQFLPQGNPPTSRPGARG